MALFRMKPHYRKSGGIFNRLSAPVLNTPAYNFAATTVGDYALFAGGAYTTHSSGQTNVVTAYNSNLIKTTPEALYHAAEDLAATTVGNYALFAGGHYSYSPYTYNYITAYNTSLTRSWCDNMTHSRERFAAATVGNYAFFAGGYAYTALNKGAYVDGVEMYDTSLIKYNASSSLSKNRQGLKATTVGDYVLFCGGRDRDGYYNIVDVYNAQGIKVYTQNPINNFFACAKSIGNYALFVARSNTDVEVYDNALTHSLAPSLAVLPRDNIAGASIGEYVLFAGRRDNNVNITDVYDTTLIHSLALPLTHIVNNLAATTVGNYALFAGGYAVNSDGIVIEVIDTVDVFQVA